MTRTAAAATFRSLRATFITEQNARCTIYGQRADVDSFNVDVGRYIANVEGISSPSPADYVNAVKSMLDYLRAS